MEVLIRARKVFRNFRVRRVNYYPFNITLIRSLSVQGRRCMDSLFQPLQFSVSRRAEGGAEL